MPADVPTVVVVDDAPEVRILVRTRLRISGRFEVIAEGSDGEEAVELAARLRPGLMLLDVSMPGTDGLQALPRVLDASPGTRVVMFSGFEEHGLVDEAMARGAAAFVEKSTPVDLLIERLLAAVGEDGAGTDPLDLEDGSSVELRTDRLVDRGVLAEHLERFREVFDQAAIGMATTTLTGTVVRANRALARLLEVDEGELVGKGYATLALDQGGEVTAALERIRADPVDLEHVEHGVAGSAERRLLVTLAPVRDSAGRPLYVLLQVQDVTAEREALEEVRRSEGRFRLLVENVRDYAIFMLDPDGHVASWNAGAQRIMGYSIEEIVGRHFRAFYPEQQQRDRHPEHELEIALREGQYAEEGWRLRKDGSRFFGYVVITPVRDEEGDLLGFAKVTRDITERRRAEEELRQSEQRFRLLVETVEDYAIFMLDPDGRIASWNAGAERSKGYTAEEVIGRHFSIFYPPEVAASGHCEHELEMAVRDGHYEEEGWRLRKDGSPFWANVVITAIFDADGTHLGFAKVTRDNSERRRLEEERERALAALSTANAELEQLNRRLKTAADDQAQFLAVTAHELRTPVGVLGGSAEMLSQHWNGLDEAERTELLEAMESSTVRLRRLLADLLTASRLQASALSMRTDRVEVADLVAGAVGNARRTHPGAKVTTEVADGLHVVGDHDRLAQVLDNLIGNAVRHGEPPVRVVAARTGGTVELRVGDAGGGVSAAVRPRLFERFATGAVKGTGLGLYIVREIARAHGGDATYERTSGTDHGEFVITLPASPAE
ncbi:MAG TPA: PAS domain S-box protein [Marmoricola sp.]|nr:PAS domain S-box protein [Marmoricola sp.]